MLMHYNWFLIKLLTSVLLHLIMFLIYIKLKKCVIKSFSRKLLMLKFCLDRYKTEEMCHRVADAFLLARKFVSDCFVTNKLIEKLDNYLLSKDDIVYVDTGSDIVTFFNIDIDLNSINLNNIKLDGDNFDDYNPETIYQDL